VKVSLNCQFELRGGGLQTTVGKPSP
jgi:hypothetical protein